MRPKGKMEKLQFKPVLRYLILSIDQRVFNDISNVMNLSSLYPRQLRKLDLND